MQHGATTESKSGNETEAVSVNYFGILHNWENSKKKLVYSNLLF